MPLQIITNNHERQFRYRYEVPTEVLESQFDYQNEDETTGGFFEYKGCWYHLDQFMRIPGGPGFEGWDSASADSFFSGVLISLSDDGETYRVGTYIERYG